MQRQSIGEENTVGKFEIHPCFSGCSNGYARIHLPVAPACNIQCNYCVRKFCCANECRPGVTARVMTPQEAELWYCRQKTRMPELVVAGIAGPGDALANWDSVRDTLRRIRTRDSRVLFCLSTNGLLLPESIAQIREEGVGYLTVTVNCLGGEVGAKVYDHIYFHQQSYTGQSAADLLWKQQRTGIAMAKANGLTVKINCVAIRGINEKTIVSVAQKAAELQCDVMNIIPLLPVQGSRLEKAEPVSAQTLAELRRECALYIRQMTHCQRCRADAVGKV